MSTPRTCFGIYRELAHSPGRVVDDAAIMECVGTALEARGFTVDLLDAQAIDRAVITPSANIFAMCERGAILDRLATARQCGAIVINTPDAVRNTYRHRMIELFARHHVSSPASRIVATDAQGPPPEACVWIKRYDFHATQSDDVMYAASEEGWRYGLSSFAARGIPFVIVQEHVHGDLIKFYGVGNGSAQYSSSAWFQWFYHRDKGMIGHAFDTARLRQVACDAAAALGVEIFGGDAIIRPDGEPVIVDLNAWPSYALYRDQAAEAIADYLTDRFWRRPRAVT
jgi:hypothetical protein